MKNNPLQSSPERVERFGEIATSYDGSISEVFNRLSSPERVFVYYLYRACLPGNTITSGQLHRDALVVKQMIQALVDGLDQVESIEIEGFDQFFDQLKVYLVYLVTNHSQYFAKEHINQKRTPEKLGLKKLTYDNLLKALQAINYPDAQEVLDRVSDALFVVESEPTLCTMNSIAQSAVNFYAPGFTEDDYQKLSPAERNQINAYFYHEGPDRAPAIQLAKIGGRFSDELEVADYWLGQAYEHAAQYPTFFDSYLVESLSLLRRFLRTGQEQDFRQHSIAWLKSNSVIDYCFGFIETYDDPKSMRGSFQAEVTVKSVDIQKLNEILPSLEAQLPLPEEYKRDNLQDLSKIPNASINVQLFGSGHAGPLSITAAYCLPNYNDIRSEHGSKQIIYQAGKGLGESLNPDRYQRLFNNTQQFEWLRAHDPDNSLHKDIWTVHCILHETLGHGSGKLHKHTFKQGEALTIGNVAYAIGDTIEVTTDNVAELLQGHSAALEELRAEIIALYTSIFCFDQLAERGLYKDWPAKIGKQALIEQLIFDMAWTGLRRLLTQDKNTEVIVGAHAQANTAIMNYLLDGNGLKLVQENVELDDQTYTVLGFEIVNLDQVLRDIKELMIKVQTIKSTADVVAVDRLFAMYGSCIRNRDHLVHMHRNLEAVLGQLKVAARIYPQYEPIKNEVGDIVDCAAHWPATLIEQFQHYQTVALSKE